MSKIKLTYASTIFYQNSVQPYHIRVYHYTTFEIVPDFFALVPLLFVFASSSAMRDARTSLTLEASNCIHVV